MKKLTLISMMAAVLFAGCAKDDTVAPGEAAGVRTITATIGADETRAAFDAEVAGKMPIHWETNDEIGTLIDSPTWGEDGTIYTYKLEGDGGSNTGKFNLVGDNAPEKVTTVYYPASILDVTHSAMSTPACPKLQTYTAGSFDAAACVLKSTVKDGVAAAFEPVYSIACLQLTGSVSVKSIAVNSVTTLTCAEPVALDAATATPFYIVVPTQSATDLTFIVTTSEDKVMEIIKKDATLAKGKVHRFPAKEFAETALTPVVTITSWAFNGYQDETLGAIELKGSAKLNGEVVAGTLAWETPEYIFTAEDLTAKKVNKTWKFTPDDADKYNVATGEKQITVMAARTELTLVSGPGDALKGAVGAALSTVTATVTAKNSEGEAVVVNFAWDDPAYILTEADAMGVAKTWTATAANTNKNLYKPLTGTATITAVVQKEVAIKVTGTYEVLINMPLNTIKTPITGTHVAIDSGEEVAGTFAWKNPYQSFQESGSQSVSVVFTPTSTDYKAAETTVTITVNKQPITVDETKLSDLTLTAGAALSTLTPVVTAKDSRNFPVDGTFAWDAPETTFAEAGTKAAAWTFTPDDDITYAAVTGTASITVEAAVVVKKNVTVELTTDFSAAKAGQQLSEFTLAGKVVEEGTDTEITGGTFAWVNADAALAEGSNADQAYTWTPGAGDTDKYEAYNGTVTITTAAPVE